MRAGAVFQEVHGMNGFWQEDTVSTPPTGLNIANEVMVMKITPVDSIWRVTFHMEKRLL